MNSINEQQQQQQQQSPTQEAGAGARTDSAQTNPLKRPLTIMFCLPGKSFSNHFLLSWSELMMYCLTHQIRPLVSCQQNSNVYHVRNACLGADILRGSLQLPFDGKLDYDFIMWIDSDQVFSPAQFETLLRHDKEVVSGLYLMQGARQYAAVRDWDVSYFKKHGRFEFLTRPMLEQWVENNCIGTPTEKKNEQTGQVIKDYSSCTFPLMKVSYTGFGWTLVKKGVFEKMTYPWFNATTEEFELTNEKDGSVLTIKELLSEDVSLCKRLETLGIPLYVDVRAIVGHEKTIVL